MASRDDKNDARSAARPPARHLGQKLRALRRRESLTQQQLAERLAVSPAYLNLIENGRRPLPAHMLIALAQLFQLDLSTFAVDDDAELRSQLLEVFGDPLFDHADLIATDVGDLAAQHPTVGRAVLSLYRALQAARQSGGEDDARAGALPSEEVSDFLQRHLNHFPDIEALAEDVRAQCRGVDTDLGQALVGFLQDKLDVSVHIHKAITPEAQQTLRRYDKSSRRLMISELLPPRSRNFQLAHQIALLVGRDLLDRLTAEGGFTTPEARALARMALANAFGGAVLMPYLPFLEAAEQARYDVELLGHRFRTSFEQVCHRLCTLRRPGALGVPFHFIRVDIAGNISKRFSGSGIRFARYAGACPRWNVFSAFMTPGMIKTQVSAFPDGSRFFCIATTLRRVAQGYSPRHALHAVGLGCDVSHAHRLVYADGVDLARAVPVGVTCRLCTRQDCDERAFPAQQVPLRVDEDVRAASFYQGRLPIVG
jgi:predicted transcriptional regulator/transcriptional regulator with XRE-family HTH domain